VKFIGSAVEYLLGGARVGGANEVRLRRWFALPDANLVLPHARARYVVGDFETSGSGPGRGRLISIGAVVVAQMQIDLAGCFSTVLRQDHASTDANILVHGVGGQAQLAGVEPATSMLDFLEHLGKAPLVAFHADPARAVVDRAMRSILGVPFRHAWIDLSALLAALHPKVRCATLEDWLVHFGLAAGTWHDSLADAFVTAQLVQVALDAATRAGMTNARRLVDLQHVSRPNRKG
jgi:DNA polymerase-3 subunit epsilon